MGLFKDMKHMKDTVAAAPGLIQQAQDLQAASQQMAAQQPAMGVAGYGAPAPGPGAPAALSEADLAPVAGVSLALYAEITRDLATVRYDLSRAPALAAARGISADAWASAVEGWNRRMAATPALAQHFNRLYTGRAEG